MMSRLNDPENFSGRVNYACAVIASGRSASRALDNCFENHDGDQVAIAVYRRSLKNPKIAKNLSVYLGPGTIEKCKTEWANVPARDLPKLAAAARANRKAEFAAWLATVQPAV